MKGHVYRTPRAGLKREETAVVFRYLRRSYALTLFFSFGVLYGPLSPVMNPVIDATVTFTKPS